MPGLVVVTFWVISYLHTLKLEFKMLCHLSVKQNWATNVACVKQWEIWCRRWWLWRSHCFSFDNYSSGLQSTWTSDICSSLRLSSTTMPSGRDLGEMYQNIRFWHLSGLVSCLILFTQFVFKVSLVYPLSWPMHRNKIDLKSHFCFLDFGISKLIPACHLSFWCAFVKEPIHFPPNIKTDCHGSVL